MFYHLDYGLFNYSFYEDNDGIPKEIKDQLEDIFDRKKDGLFHNLNGDDKRDQLKTIYCKICGGKEFYVGQGSYFTALKCKKCNWEACVHDG